MRLLRGCAAISAPGAFCMLLALLLTAVSLCLLLCTPTFIPIHSFGSLQEAAAAPELPATLRNKVLRLRWPIDVGSPDEMPSSSSDDGRDNWMRYGGERMRW